MHVAFMLIGIRTTLIDSQVFQVTSHIVGLVVLCAEIPIHLLSMHHTYSLLTCTRIPCRSSHCENGRVKCCIYKNQGNHRCTRTLHRGNGAVRAVGTSHGDDETPAGHKVNPTCESMLKKSRRVQVLRVETT